MQLKNKFHLMFLQYIAWHEVKVEERTGKAFHSHKGWQKC